MASNAIRANATLPWLLLAQHHRSNRTLRRRDADASCSGSAGTSGSRSPARSCACCVRASFSSRCVFLGRPLLFLQLNVLSFREADRELPATHPIGFQLLPGHSRMSRYSSLFHNWDRVPCSLHGIERTQAPCFSHCRSQVERYRKRVERIDIGVIRCILAL